MDTRIALGVNNAPINALGSFAQGEGQVAGVEASHMQHAKDTIEMVGAGAMHALNGDINGEVDPVKYGEVMDSFEQMGVDVSKFRDNPEFAKVAAHASVGALNELNQANADRNYQHVIDEWQHQLEQDAASNTRADRSLDILAQNANTKAAAAASTGVSGDIPTQIANSIMRGEQPPNTTGLYKYGAAVRAKLAESGYDLAGSQLDFASQTKHYAALESPQQNRMKQAIATLDGSLDLVQSLAEQWDAGGYQDINAARATLARGGVLGPGEDAIIKELDAQIKDVNAELANVYMGGNSPTEQALKLAEHSLNSDWSLETITKMVEQAKANIAFRKNAIQQSESDRDSRYHRTPDSGGGTSDDSDVTIEPMPGN